MHSLTVCSSSRNASSSARFGDLAWGEWLAEAVEEDPDDEHLDDQTGYEAEVLPGMALRFARVLRYRDDKSPAEADTIDTVRAFYERGS